MFAYINNTYIFATNLKMKILFIAATALIISCGSRKTMSDNKDQTFKNFNYPEVNFVNKAEGTEGWEIYK